MLVLLDRDGVINEDTAEGISDPKQLRLIKGSARAIARLNAADFKVAVVTNQSVVGKGLISETELASIHETLQTMLAEHGAYVDEIYWCGDPPDAPTPRRKPGSAMLQEALQAFGAKAAQTPMVGDALRDLQAAKTAGCERHLVRTGKGARTAQQTTLKGLAPVKIHDDLAAFVTYWLHEHQAMA